MKSVDLHIHSCYSDGIFTPEEIVVSAKEKGIKCISITDHDSISAQYIVNTEYNNDDFKIIPGIELSTEYNEMELHILGYFIDINDARLNELVDNLNKQRIKRVEQILSNLKKHNINLDFEDIAVDMDSTIGRSHVANAMVNKGYFDSYKNAFRSYLVKGKPGYVKGFKLNYKESLDIIKGAGGISVLAHPGQIYKKIEIENIIRELRCFGLNGLEVYHPSHSCVDINKFFSMAKKYKLSITGGSDFHGSTMIHEQKIGSYGIDENLLNKLINIKK